MITFKRMRYSDIPIDIANRVKNYSDKEVIIDDAGLTRAELKKLIDFMEQEGYKES